MKSAEIVSKFFGIASAGSSIKREVTGGITTFMTMAYIIFVNPQILHAAGMNSDSVMVATCLSASFATLFMGFFANYPIALAPGMGMNAFFAYEICRNMGVTWQAALGFVFVEGVIFVFLTFTKVRIMIVDAIPGCMKVATAAGIGVFIAFIGLKEAGIITSHPATFVTVGSIKCKATILAVCGVFVAAALIALKVRGAILISILLTGIAGIPIGVVEFKGIVSSVPSVAPTFAQLDLSFIFSWSLMKVYITPILILLFFDMFDTIGTMVGISEQAGFTKEGRIPRAEHVLASDALGTVAGGVFGTSTVTSYIESAAGIADGARTGLASIVTGLLFLVALFFSPLANMLGSGFETPSGLFLHPVTAPALIIVGCFMMKTVTKINWDDFSDAVPAFLTIITMPLTFSIANGLAIGFISYPAIKLLCGKGRQVHWLAYILGALFVLRYAFLD